MDKRRAVLIESHPLLRQTLVQLLLSAGLAVDEPVDAVDGVCIAVRARPEFVILDATLTDMSGLLLGALIRRLAPQSKVILLVDDAREYDQLAKDNVIACLSKRTVGHELPLLIHRWPSVT
jgi:DNA-binding response OmpR family regulator